MKLRLIGVAAALAATAPSFAVAAPTIRVEGGSATLIPQMQLVGGTTFVRDTTDTDVISVPMTSATGQLGLATGLFGLPLGFDLFDFGGPSSFVTQIGPNKMPPSFSPAWRLKVNHKLTDVGADAVIVKPDDHVLWSFAADFDAPELDLRVARRVITSGQDVAVQVVKFDNTGAATPAAGAKIAVTTPTTRRTVRADASGRARVDLASAPGTYRVSATLSGAVRSQAHLVCVQVPGPRQPCSAVTFPRPGETSNRPQILAGTVIAPPLPNARRTSVHVSLARLIDGQCSFLNRDRATFTEPRPCNERVNLQPTIKSDRTWSIILNVPAGLIDGPGGLETGKYRVWSRQTLGTRRETRRTLGVNTVDFQVVAP